jgi:transcriptional regulator with XRE-family HTH domain
MPENDKQLIIATRIKAARQLAGLSQGQVAKLMNMHRPSISEIEAANRKVSAAELSRFAEIFDVGASYLMGEAPEVIGEDDERLKLAARELSKLSPDALNGLLRALAAVQSDTKANKK